MMEARTMADSQPTTSVVPQQGQAQPIARAPVTGQAPASPGVQALQHVLGGRQGPPPVPSVVTIVNDYPADHDAMFALLHTQLGNSYVQQVMAQIKQGQNPTRWQQFKNTVVDGVEIALELKLESGFNIFTGELDAELDIGKVLYYAQLILPIQALHMIVLNAADRGSNPVHVRMNVYHKTIDVSAPTLKIAGFHNASFSAGTCVLLGLKAHGEHGLMTASFATAEFMDVTFTRGKDRLGAHELVMTNLIVSDSSGGAQDAGSLKFGSAHVHGISYPDMPPVDFDMAGGASFDALWSQVAGGPKNHPASPESPLPRADVLPKGSKITIDLEGLHGDASIGATSSSGQTAFTHMRAALVQNGHDLASVTIDGFNAGGEVGPGPKPAATGGAMIDKVVLAGDPALAQALLSSPDLARNALVKQAVDLVRGVGLSPAIGGTITATHITAGASPMGETGHADFVGHLDIPQLGLLDLKLTNMAVSHSEGATQVAATSFDRLAMTLHDHSNKQEIAHLELAGGSGTAHGDSRHAEIKLVEARGQVAKLVQAGQSVVHQLPPSARGALQAVAALGVTGEITGSLSIDSKGKSDEITGSFDAEIAAGTAGKVSMKVGSLHIRDGGAMSFASFTAVLRDPHGKQAATLIVTDGSSPGPTPHATTKFTANRIDARGDDSSLTTMIGAIEAQSTTLPAPIKTSFDMVRKFYAQAGGHLVIDKATAGADRAGNDTARAADINAEFDMDGAGTAKIQLTGFHTVGNAKAGTDSIDFTKFVATLIDAKDGKRAATITVVGSSDKFIQVHGSEMPDYDMHAKQIDIAGNTKEAAALLSGMRQHLPDLPGPVVSAFKLIEKYGHNLAATGAASASDVALSSHGGKVAGQGDISARVELTDGELEAKLVGARTDDNQLAFDALDVTLRDHVGVVAGSVHAEGVKADAAGRTASLTAVKVTGDATRMQTVLDPKIQRLLPASFAQALAMLKGSDLAVSASNVAVAETAGHTSATASVIKASGALSVKDAAGNVYTCKDATLELDGPQLQLGPDNKPRDVTATGMTISGQFSTSGAGSALRGIATLRTGAAHITLNAAGAPTSVSVSTVYVAGSADRQVAAATAAAATSAVAATATPSKSRQLAQNASETQTAEQIAQAIRSADISANIPLFAGRYGRGLVSVGVPADAAISVSVQVRNNALTKGSVQFTPPLDLPAWLKAKGVDLQTKGSDGLLKARVSGWFDQDVTKYVVGKGHALSLDLPMLVDEVMGNIRAGIVAAKPESEKAEAAGARKAAGDEQWLDKQHEHWQSDVVKHERDDARRSASDRQKREGQDAGKEPRSADVADVATKGVDLGGISGSADLVLAKTGPSGAITGHLHGQTQGMGKLELTADALDAQIAGNDVSVRGLNSGTVALSDTATTTHVELNGLTISQLNWSPTTTTR
jgi:hypothetical protein